VVNTSQAGTSELVAFSSVAFDVSPPAAAAPPSVELDISVSLPAAAAPASVEFDISVEPDVSVELAISPFSAPEAEEFVELEELSADSPPPAAAFSSV
jgi:hypothetical protein